jgi:hypothetical protein
MERAKKFVIYVLHLTVIKMDVLIIILAVVSSVYLKR